MTKTRVLHILTIIIILLAIIATSVGAFYNDGGAPFDTINQYGETIKIYGKGIYAHDSYFMAPLFRGTDFAILILAVPLLIIALLYDIKKQSIKARMFLLSMLTLFVYYSASLSFGVTYNKLFLVYMLLFSTSLFALIIAFMSMDMSKITLNKFPFKTIYTFLIVVAICLFVAWLPDIITSLKNGTSLGLIEVYTTSITYVIDMGIISPAAIVCAVLIKQRSGLGYVLLEALLTLCFMVGVILPMQSVFQINAGITIPLPVLITKIATFCILALISLPLEIKLIKNINM